MSTYITLTLQAQSIRNWHDEIRAASDSALKRWSFLNDTPKYAGSIVQKLLNDPEACKYFGAPEGNPPNLDGTDRMSEWMRHFWGRRVYYFLNALRRGYRATRRLDNSVGDTLDNLTSATEQLAATYKIPTLDVVARALRTRKDMDIRVLARMPFSTTDPFLYASLTYLSMIEERGNPLELKAIENFFMSEVSSQLSYYLSTLSGDLNNPITEFDDVSNLWRAHAVLLKRQGKAYLIKDYSKWSGAVEVCHMLLGHKYNEKHLVVRKDELSAYDLAAPEVYDLARTRLYIFLSCIHIAEVIPAAIDEELPDRLSYTALDHFSKLSDVEMLKHHIYRLGLALQVSSVAIEYCNKQSASQHEKKQTTVDQACDEITPSIIAKTRQDSYVVTNKGQQKQQEIQCTEQERNLLTFLYDNPNERFTRGQLEDKASISNASACAINLLKNNPRLKGHLRRPQIGKVSGFALFLDNTMEDNKR